MRLARIVFLAIATSLALPAVAQTESDMQILAQKVKADKEAGRRGQHAIDRGRGEGLLAHI